MIEFSQVTLSYSGAAVIEDVSFRVDQGEHVALTGPSGCGKSSILMAALGFRVPSSGSIRIKDMTLSPKTVRAIRRTISTIEQEPILGDETVRAALLLPFTYHHLSMQCPDETAIHGLLDAVHLSQSILSQRCSELSGGEKQRIAIVRAILMKRPVVFADEITSALDRNSKEAVCAILNAHTQTILSVSHDPAWLDRCSRVITMESGRILSDTGRAYGKS